VALSSTTSTRSAPRSRPFFATGRAAPVCFSNNLAVHQSVPVARVRHAAAAPAPVPLRSRPRFEKQTAQPSRWAKNGATSARWGLVVDDNATSRRFSAIRFARGKCRKQRSERVEALKYLRAAAAAGTSLRFALAGSADAGDGRLDLARTSRRIRPLPPPAHHPQFRRTGLERGRTFGPPGVDAHLIKPVKQSRLFDCLADSWARLRRGARSRRISSRRPRCCLRPLPGSASWWRRDNWVNQRWRGPVVEAGYAADIAANGLEVWRPCDSSRMRSYSWIARCRRWMATRQPEPSPARARLREPLSVEGARAHHRDDRERDER